MTEIGCTRKNFVSLDMMPFWHQDVSALSSFSRAAISSPRSCKKLSIAPGSVDRLNRLTVAKATRYAMA
jgi:hypothetical protein